ncbi:MAG: hypothetical protein AAF694_24220 [Bacteroidota bacterium]
MRNIQINPVISLKIQKALPLSSSIKGALSMNQAFNFFFLLLLFLPSVHNAQISTEYVTLGYLGHYAFQPGIQAGVQLSLKELPSKLPATGIEQTLFVHPQMARFTRPSLNEGVLPQVDVGYRRKKTDKYAYWSVAVGLGYLFEDTFESFSVDLATGDDRRRKTVRDYAWVTLLNVEHGFRISDELRGYIRVSSGPKFYREKKSSLATFLGTGIKFSLK